MASKRWLGVTSSEQLESLSTRYRLRLCLHGLLQCGLGSISTFEGSGTIGAAVLKGSGCLVIHSRAK